MKALPPLWEISSEKTLASVKRKADIILFLFFQGLCFHCGCWLLHIFLP